MDKDGILLINKSEGVSSAGSLNGVKRACGVKSMGHAGTLDPFATGLLISCTGRATKILPYFTDLSKTYKAIFKLGEQTSTDDKTGDVIKTSSKQVSLEEIKNAIPLFVGKIMQTPPFFSAIKVEGERAYNLARKEVQFELKQRETTVFSYDVLQFNAEKKELEVEIHCGKGTYIRSLARDLGETLGTYAHVKELCRTAIGSYTLAQAKKDTTILKNDIMEVKDFFNHLPKLTLKKQYEKVVLNGAPLLPHFILVTQNSIAAIKDGYIPSYYTLYREEGTFIALINNATHKALFMVLSL